MSAIRERSVAWPKPANTAFSRKARWCRTPAAVRLAPSVRVPRFSNFEAKAAAGCAAHWAKIRRPVGDVGGCSPIPSAAIRRTRHTPRRRDRYVPPKATILDVEDQTEGRSIWWNRSTIRLSSSSTMTRTTADAFIDPQLSVRCSRSNSSAPTSSSPGISIRRSIARSLRGNDGTSPVCIITGQSREPIFAAN
jgi:hypothetical protein